MPPPDCAKLVSVDQNSPGWAREMTNWPTLLAPQLIASICPGAKTGQPKPELRPLHRHPQQSFARCSPLSPEIIGLLGYCLQQVFHSTLNQPSCAVCHDTQALPKLLVA